MTLFEFRVQYPEFVSAPDPYVQAFLDRAALRVDRGIWGTIADEGHGLLTAHLMVTSPNGQYSRLQTDKGKSTYQDAFDRLVVQVTAGVCRVC